MKSSQSLVELEVIYQTLTNLLIFDLIFEVIKIVTACLDRNKKKLDIRKYLDFSDYLKLLSIGGVIWLIIFNFLGYLNQKSIKKKAFIYQEWQQQKNRNNIDKKTRSSQKIIAKYREIAALKKTIASQEAAKKTIDITYSNQRQQAAKMPPGAIALTFDDGPSANTHKILNILKKYQAKATFFVTGLTVKYGCEILKRIYNEGHEIANHTYDHSYLPGKSFKQQKWQLETTQKAIKKCLGINYNTRWFRAPYGAQDSNTIKAARNMGLNTALWTIDTNDWQPTITVNKIINEVIKSRGQDIVLMHDTKDKTVAALESIIINLNRVKVKYMTLSDAFAIEDEHLPHIIPTLNNLNSISSFIPHIMPED